MEVINGRIVDISFKGARIVTDHPLEKRSEYKLMIDFGIDIFTCEAEIAGIYIGMENCYGISFKNISH